MAAIGVLMGVAGWGFGYREAQILAIAALLAVVLALAWTAPRPSVRARRTVVPKKVARGDAAQAVVVLANTGTRPLRGLRAEDRVAGAPVLPVMLPTVAPGAEVSARYPLPTHTRGSVEVGPMALVRTDPLGLGRRSREHGAVETLLVRPRTVPLPVLPAGRTHHLEGPTSDTAEDGTLTFHSLREYTLGDDLRRVHWKSTARTGVMMVRRMIDVSLPTTTIVLDTAPASYASEGARARDSDTFELAVEVAASVSTAVARKNFPVRVLTGAGPLVGADGRDPGAGRLLDLFALVGADEEHRLTEAFEALERGRDSDTLVVVTGTGTGTSTQLDALGRVTRRFDRVVLVRVAAPASPPPGPVPLPVHVTRLLVTDLEELARAWHREAMR
ncbi:DUF58 domain-containing protein [Embleya sp. NBC_00896]|uniref:DUF58 domain-containing protein n=1 Tax=Embleya sp. NBC_00896 TaxID=2975961 RepID=UPI00386B8F26|nr:DUF58 domain-containing protein [Embleya sp. NBC_00896]